MNSKEPLVVKRQPERQSRSKRNMGMLKNIQNGAANAAPDASIAGDPGKFGPEDFGPEFDLIGRGMAQWYGERPDIDCSGKAVVGRILRLQDVILKAVNAALARHGLKYTTYAILATLRVSGAPYR